MKTKEEKFQKLLYVLKKTCVDAFKDTRGIFDYNVYIDRYDGEPYVDCLGDELEFVYSFGMYSDYYIDEFLLESLEEEFKEKNDMEKYRDEDGFLDRYGTEYSDDLMTYAHNAIVKEVENMMFGNGANWDMENICISVCELEDIARNAIDELENMEKDCEKSFSTAIYVNYKGFGTIEVEKNGETRRIMIMDSAEYDGSYHNGICNDQYFAPGMDIFGNKYFIYWDMVDNYEEIEDKSEICHWYKIADLEIEGQNVLDASDEYLLYIAANCPHWDLPGDEFNPNITGIDALKELAERYEIKISERDLDIPNNILARIERKMLKKL